MVTPRLMTKAEAAAYCAVTPSRFAELVEQGVYRPAPFDADLFDRRVLDAPLHPIDATPPVKMKRVGNYRRKATPEPVVRVVKWTGVPAWARTPSSGAGNASKKEGNSNA